MRIVVTGGCGFLGQRVALKLLERSEVEELVLFDNAAPATPLPNDNRLRLVTGDVADRETVRAAILPGITAVFHLAAVVSGQAEADTDLGYRVNLDGTRTVLDACRALGTCPRVIFASSLAVYGGRAAASRRRRYGAHAADLLRNAEGDRRASRQRLQPEGLRRWPRRAPADRRRAAGPPQPRGIGLRLFNQPRTACGPRGDLPGLARYGDGAGLAPTHRRGAPTGT